jgi:hypothetical protein
MKRSFGTPEIEAELVIACGSYCARNLTADHVPDLTAYDSNLIGNGNVPKIEQSNNAHIVMGTILMTISAVELIALTFVYNKDNRWIGNESKNRTT